MTSINQKNTETKENQGLLKQKIDKKNQSQKSANNIDKGTEEISVDAEEDNEEEEGDES